MLEFLHSVNRVKNSKRNHAFCGVFLEGCASKSLLASSKYKNTVQHSMEGKCPLSGEIAFFCIVLGNAHKGKTRQRWQDVRKEKKNWQEIEAGNWPKGELWRFFANKRLRQWSGLRNTAEWKLRFRLRLLTRVYRQGLEAKPAVTKSNGSGTETEINKKAN